MKLSNIDEGYELEELDELTRVELLNRAKEDTSARYDRRMTIADDEIRYYPIDVSRFYDKDRVLFPFRVRDYDVNVEISGILAYMRENLGERRVNYRTIRSLLTKALDSNDVKVNCTCPDFRYRFAYTATKDGFKEGAYETRPSDRTNPDGKGGVCKHLIRILNNKRWLDKYVSLINVLVKLRPDVLSRG